MYVASKAADYAYSYNQISNYNATVIIHSCTYLYHASVCLIVSYSTVERLKLTFILVGSPCLNYVQIYLVFNYLANASSSQSVLPSNLPCCYLRMYLVFYVTILNVETNIELFCGCFTANT